MAEPSRVLLDTNVWLDAFDGARPRSRAANSLIDICVRKGIELLYAVGTAKDVYFLVGASLKRQARAAGETLSEARAHAVSAYAAACVENMDEFATAVGLYCSFIWVELNYDLV